MKICKHICFFFKEERVKFINRIIREVNTYPYPTDIFIHTNEYLKKQIFRTNTNGNLNIITHIFEKDKDGNYIEHPFNLTWKCRKLLKSQINLYDIFMYIEDDILFYKNALKYWIKYKDKVQKMGFNLGFIRVEIDSSGEKYWTDSPGKKLHSTWLSPYSINGLKYIMNKIQPYWAGWIHDKKEFTRWVNSKYWDINNITNPRNCSIRPKSAIGFSTMGYAVNVIPVIDNKLHMDCIVHHMANNNLAESNAFSTIKFDDAIKTDIVPRRPSSNKYRHTRRELFMLRF